MPSDDELLEELATHGDMDYAQWPGLLERILPRLDMIVYNMFPIPSIPLPEPSLALRSHRRSDHPSGDNTPPPKSPKDNIILETPPTGQSPRLQHLPMSPPRFRPLPDSSIAGPPGTLPPQLLSLLSSLKSTLKTSFSTAPPHTAQRLAELILRPTRHYRTLPSYLRALDRVLSVSSPANVFPFPPPESFTATGNGRLLNGSSTPDSSASGSDDFIGGAELTPIPWLNVNTMASYLSGERSYMSDLRTESTALIDGPNGAGSLETVTVSVNGISSRNRDGVTSRAERPCTGPVSSHSSHGVMHAQPQNGIAPSMMDDNANGEEEEEVEVEEREIARGPDVIGMEDIGPQGANTQIFAVDTIAERPQDEDDTIQALALRRERRRFQDEENDDNDDNEKGRIPEEDVKRPTPDPPDQNQDQEGN